MNEYNSNELTTSKIGSNEGISYVPFGFELGRNFECECGLGDGRGKANSNLSISIRTAQCIQKIKTLTDIDELYTN